MTYCTIKREERWDMLEALAMEAEREEDEAEKHAIREPAALSAHLGDRVIPDIEELKEHEGIFVDGYRESIYKDGTATANRSAAAGSMASKTADVTAASAMALKTADVTAAGAMASKTAEAAVAKTMAMKPTNTETMAADAITAKIAAAETATAKAAAAKAATAKDMTADAAKAKADAVAAMDAAFAGMKAVKRKIPQSGEPVLSARKSTPDDGRRARETTSKFIPVGAKESSTGNGRSDDGRRNDEDRNAWYREGETDSGFVSSGKEGTVVADSTKKNAFKDNRAGSKNADRQRDESPRPHLSQKKSRER
jgi:hypothetical protein